MLRQQNVLNYIFVILIPVFGVINPIQAIEPNPGELSLKQKNEVLEALSDNIDARNFYTMDHIQDFPISDFYDDPLIGSPNLYLHILNEMMYSPFEKTLEYAADELGFFKSKEDYIDYFQAETSIQVKEAFKNNTKLVEDTHLLELKSIAFELFSNGNTDDSSFDLLDNLNELEFYLFGENTPWEYFELPEDSRATSRPTELSPEVEEIPEEEVADQLEERVQNPEDFNNELSQSNQPDITPDQCGVSPVIFQEIFPEEEPLDDQIEPEENLASNEETPDQPQSNLEITSSELEFKTFPDVNPFVCRKTEFTIDELSSGTPEERYCFYVEAFPEPIGLQTPNSDCTLCSFKGIYSELVETNDQPLLPAKITGHYFEPPFCKKYIFTKLFSINLVLEERPLFPTDSPFKQLNDLDPAKIGEQIKVRQKTPNLLDTQIDIDSDLQGFIESYQQTLIKQTELLTESQTNVMFQEGNLVQKGVFSQIQRRLEVFNALFIELKNLMEDMNEISQNIINKPSCND